MTPHQLAKLAREKLEQWDRVEYRLPSGGVAVWERPQVGHHWLSMRRWLSAQPQGGEVLTYCSGQLRRRCTLTEDSMNQKDLYEIGKTLGELMARVARLEQAMSGGSVGGVAPAPSAAPAKEPTMADMFKLITAMAKGDMAAVAAAQGGELGELGELAAMMGGDKK